MKGSFDCTAYKHKCNNILICCWTVFQRECAKFLPEICTITYKKKIWRRMRQVVTNVKDLELVQSLHHFMYSQVFPNAITAHNFLQHKQRFLHSFMHHNVPPPLPPLQHSLPLPPPLPSLPQVSVPPPPLTPLPLSRKLFCWYIYFV